MAIRNLLAQHKLEAFRAWLGDRALPPKGYYEVLRWKNGPGKPMCIVFRKPTQKDVHYSCNDAAEPDVRRFIRETRA